MVSRHYLTDEQWAIIELLISKRKLDPGHPLKKANGGQFIAQSCIAR